MDDTPTISIVGDKLKPDALLDVIFIHGLTGNHFDTWTNNGEMSGYWPSWLAEDFPKCNILTANYDAAAVADVFAGSGLSITEYAETLTDIMTSYDIGQRPIVFVAHSLGGVIVKEILMAAYNSVDSDKKAIQDSTLGIVFLGTPHKGSVWSNIASLLSKPIATKLQTGLTYANENLLKVDKWFRHHWGNTSGLIKVYCEGKKTKGILIVDRVSSDPGVSGVEPVVVTLDHISLAKPKDKSSQVYLGTHKLINTLVSDLSKTTQVLDSDEQDLDLIDPESPLAKDYDYYTNPISPTERETLEEKLNAGGRGMEIRQAKRAKHDFSMLINKNTLQRKPVEFFGKLLSDVSTRYGTLVYPQILNGMGYVQVNRSIHEDVIQPVHETFKDNDFKPISKRTVQGALYYLGGHCHVRWNAHKQQEDDNGDS